VNEVSIFATLRFWVPDGSGQTTISLKRLRFNEDQAKDDVSAIVTLTVLGVNDNKNQVPSHFELSQNYPNPFNPVTTISYALPQSAYVTLGVYNTLGERVALLVDGEQQAGYHNVELNGSGLASGVYFYRIQAGSFMDVKKLVLMK
jgi:hypothetical protein